MWKGEKAVHPRNIRGGYNIYEGEFKVNYPVVFLK